jgi:hypothetical protein
VATSEPRWSNLAGDLSGLGRPATTVAGALGLGDVALLTMPGFDLNL